MLLLLWGWFLVGLNVTFIHFWSINTFKSQLLEKISIGSVYKWTFQFFSFVL
jgi:hypothetical protein